MNGEETPRSALFERAVSRLRTAWRDLTSGGRVARPAPADPDLPDEELPAQTTRCLSPCASASTP